MEFRTRKLIKHSDLNPSGSLFGGRALEWIDEEAYIVAQCQCPHANHLVTKVMSDINFMAPAHLGDVIEIGMEVIKFGNTSVTLKGSLRNKTTKQQILSIDKIVFVNLDNNGKPIRYDIPLHEIECDQYAEEIIQYAENNLNNEEQDVLKKQKDLWKSYTC